VNILALGGLAFLGIVSKGLPGAALPWLVLAAYGAARRDWQGLNRLGLQWVVLLTAALSAAWLAAAGAAAGWDYPASLVIKQSVERALNPWHHQAPWYYFLGIFWSDGLPYSLVLVPMIAPLIRGRSWKEPGALLPLVWMAVYLLVFSLSGGKRSVYILPLFPAMALMLAYGLANFQLQRWPVAGLRRVLLFLSAFFPGLFVAALFLAPPKLGPAVPWLAAGAAFLTAGSLAAWFLSGRGRVLSGAVALAASCLAFAAVTLWPLARYLDETKAPRAVVARVAPVLERGGTLAVYPNLVPSVNYYARTVTPVFKKDQRHLALAFLAESPDHLILAEGDALKEKPLKGAEAVLQTAIGQDTFYLLRAPAAPAGGS
jgi:4-amino-4-deoxy-L-arabinose transferase-like glycosyltransferase